jgi:hypothetical protein
MRHLGTFSIPSGSIPVRAFALRADARLDIDVTGHPFMATAFATKAGNFDFYLRHAQEYIPANNTLSRDILLDKYILL